MINVLVMGLNDIVGGIEMYIYNLIRYSNRDEIHFDFLCQGRDHAAFQQQIEEYYEGNVNFYFVPTFKKAFFKCVKELKRIYNKEYDIVYVNTCISTDVLYAMPFVKKNKTKLVVHSHMASLDIKQTQHKLFRKIVSGAPDLRLACSKPAAEFFWKDDYEATIISNGIDTDRFVYSEDYRKEIRSLYGIRDDQMLLGHVGRLTYLKNQSFIIDILKQIREKGIDAKLMLVGDGEDKEKIENKIRQEDLTEHVVMCGVQLETEKYYSAFDVFVMPSISEGFGIVGLEAQASGLYCLFADGFGQRIRATDKVRCLELSDNNYNDWADEIAGLIDNQQTDRSEYAKVVSDVGYNSQKTYLEVLKLLIQLVDDTRDNSYTKSQEL